MNMLLNKELVVSNRGINAKPHHVSMGGCVLRIHQIRDRDMSPKVTDICMDMEILSSLTSKSHRLLDVETNTKCVKIKYHTNKSLGTGPSLILGENGGFQWLGNPNDISESFCSIFAFMNKNMRNGSFIKAIAKSKSMAKYVYP